MHVRFHGDKMLIQRPDGRILETIIVQKIAENEVTTEITREKPGKNKTAEKRTSEKKAG